MNVWTLAKVPFGGTKEKKNTDSRIVRRRVHLLYFPVNETLQKSGEGQKNPRTNKSE